MSGSFTFSANVRIGKIYAYDKATVITVVHEYGAKDEHGSFKYQPVWNKVVCFNPGLRETLAQKIGTGDLVHFTGTVRSNSFKLDDKGEKQYSVDLVVATFDLLHKHITGVEETRLVDPKSSNE